MEEVYERTPETPNTENECIVPRVLKGGMRSYFLDVHSTQENDLYITITESKKCYDSHGHYFYERHKIFLFKEDFKELIDGLTDVISFVNSNEFDISKIQKRDNSTFEKKKTPVFIKKQVKKDYFDEFGDSNSETDSSYLNVEFENLSIPQ